MPPKSTNNSGWQTPTQTSNRKKKSTHDDKASSSLSAVGGSGREQVGSSAGSSRARSPSTSAQPPTRSFASVAAAAGAQRKETGGNSNPSSGYTSSGYRTPNSSHPPRHGGGGGSGWSASSSSSFSSPGTPHKSGSHQKHSHHHQNTSSAPSHTHHFQLLPSLSAAVAVVSSQAYIDLTVRSVAAYNDIPFFAQQCKGLDGEGNPQAGTKRMSEQMTPTLSKSGTKSKQHTDTAGSGNSSKGSGGGSVCSSSNSIICRETEIVKAIYSLPLSISQEHENPTHHNNGPPVTAFTRQEITTLRHELDLLIHDVTMSSVDSSGGGGGAGRHKGGGRGAAADDDAEYHHPSTCFFSAKDNLCASTLADFLGYRAPMIDVALAEAAKELANSSTNNGNNNSSNKETSSAPPPKEGQQRQPQQQQSPQQQHVSINAIPLQFRLPFIRFIATDALPMIVSELGEAIPQLSLSTKFSGPSGVPASYQGAVTNCYAIACILRLVSGFLFVWGSLTNISGAEPSSKQRTGFETRNDGQSNQQHVMEQALGPQLARHFAFAHRQRKFSQDAVAAALREDADPFLVTSMIGSLITRCAKLSTLGLEGSAVAMSDLRSSATFPEDAEAAVVEGLGIDNSATTTTSAVAQAASHNPPTAVALAALRNKMRLNLALRMVRHSALLCLHTMTTAAPNAVFNHWATLFPTTVPAHFGFVGENENLTHPMSVLSALGAKATDGQVKKGCGLLPRAVNAVGRRRLRAFLKGGMTTGKLEELGFISSLPTMGTKADHHADQSSPLGAGTKKSIAIKAGTSINSSSAASAAAPVTFATLLLGGGGKHPLFAPLLYDPSLSNRSLAATIVSSCFQLCHARLAVAMEPPGNYGLSTMRAQIAKFTANMMMSSASVSVCKEGGKGQDKVGAAAAGIEKGASPVGHMCKGNTLSKSDSDNANDAVALAGQQREEKSATPGKKDKAVELKRARSDTEEEGSRRRYVTDEDFHREQLIALSSTLSLAAPSASSSYTSLSTLLGHVVYSTHIAFRQALLDSSNSLLDDCCLVSNNDEDGGLSLANCGSRGRACGGFSPPSRGTPLDGVDTGVAKKRESTDGVACGSFAVSPHVVGMRSAWRSLLLHHFGTIASLTAYQYCPRSAEVLASFFTSGAMDALAEKNELACTKNEKEYAMRLAFFDKELYGLHTILVKGMRSAVSDADATIITVPSDAQNPPNLDAHQGQDRVSTAQRKREEEFEIDLRGKGVARGGGGGSHSTPQGINSLLASQFYSPSERLSAVRILHTLWRIKSLQNAAQNSWMRKDNPAARALIRSLLCLEGLSTIKRRPNVCATLTPCSAKAMVTAAKQFPWAWTIHFREIIITLQRLVWATVEDSFSNNTTASNPPPSSASVAERIRAEALNALPLYMRAVLAPEDLTLTAVDTFKGMLSYFGLAWPGVGVYSNNAAAAIDAMAKPSGLSALLSEEEGVGVRARAGGRQKPTAKGGKLGESKVIISNTNFTARNSFGENTAGEEQDGDVSSSASSSPFVDKFGLSSSSRITVAGLLTAGSDIELASSPEAVQQISTLLTSLGIANSAVLSSALSNGGAATNVSVPPMFADRFSDRLHPLPNTTSSSTTTSSGPSASYASALAHVSSQPALAGRPSPLIGGGDLDLVAAMCEDGSIAVETYRNYVWESKMARSASSALTFTSATTTERTAGAGAGKREQKAAGEIEEVVEGEQGSDEESRSSRLSRLSSVSLTEPTNTNTKKESHSYHHPQWSAIMGISLKNSDVESSNGEEEEDEALCRSGAIGVASYGMGEGRVGELNSRRVVATAVSSSSSSLCGVRGYNHPIATTAANDASSSSSSSYGSSTIPPFSSSSSVRSASMESSHDRNENENEEEGEDENTTIPRIHVHGGCSSSYGRDSTRRPSIASLLLNHGDFRLIDDFIRMKMLGVCSGPNPPIIAGDMRSDEVVKSGRCVSTTTVSATSHDHNGHRDGGAIDGVKTVKFLVAGEGEAAGAVSALVALKNNNGSTHEKGRGHEFESNDQGGGSGSSERNDTTTTITPPPPLLVSSVQGLRRSREFREYKRHLWVQQIKLLALELIAVPLLLPIVAVSVRSAERASSQAAGVAQRVDVNNMAKDKHTVVSSGGSFSSSSSSSPTPSPLRFSSLLIALAIRLVASIGQDVLFNESLITQNRRVSLIDAIVSSLAPHPTSSFGGRSGGVRSSLASAGSSLFLGGGSSHACVRVEALSAIATLAVAYPQLRPLISTESLASAPPLRADGPLNEENVRERWKASAAFSSFFFTEASRRVAFAVYSDTSLLVRNKAVQTLSVLTEVVARHAASVYKISAAYECLARHFRYPQRYEEYLTKESREKESVGLKDEEEEGDAHPNEDERAISGGQKVPKSTRKAMKARALQSANAVNSNAALLGHTGDGPLLLSSDGVIRIPFHHNVLAAPPLFVQQQQHRFSSSSSSSASVNVESTMLGAGRCFSPSVITAAIEDRLWRELFLITGAVAGLQNARSSFISSAERNSGSGSSPPAAFFSASPSYPASSVSSLFAVASLTDRSTIRFGAKVDGEDKEKRDTGEEVKGNALNGETHTIARSQQKEALGSFFSRGDDFVVGKEDKSTTTKRTKPKPPRRVIPISFIGSGDTTHTSTEAAHSVDSSSADNATAIIWLALDFAQPLLTRGDLQTILDALVYSFECPKATHLPRNILSSTLLATATNRNAIIGRLLKDGPFGNPAENDDYNTTNTAAYFTWREGEAAKSKEEESEGRGRFGAYRVNKRPDEGAGSLPSSTTKKINNKGEVNDDDFAALTSGSGSNRLVFTGAATSKGDSSGSSKRQTNTKTVGVPSLVIIPTHVLAGSLEALFAPSTTPYALRASALSALLLPADDHYMYLTSYSMEGSFTNAVFCSPSSLVPTGGGGGGKWASSHRGGPDTTLSQPTRAVAIADPLFGSISAATGAVSALIQQSVVVGGGGGGPYATLPKLSSSSAADPTRGGISTQSTAPHYEGPPMSTVSLSSIREAHEEGLSSLLMAFAHVAMTCCREGRDRAAGVGVCALLLTSAAGSSAGNDVALADPQRLVVLLNDLIYLVLTDPAFQVKAKAAAVLGAISDPIISAVGKMASSVANAAAQQTHNSNNTIISSGRSCTLDERLALTPSTTTTVPSDLCPAGFGSGGAVKRSPVLAPTPLPPSLTISEDIGTNKNDQQQRSTFFPTCDVILNALCLVLGHRSRDENSATETFAQYRDSDILKASLCVAIRLLIRRAPPSVGFQQVLSTHYTLLSEQGLL